MRDPSKELNRNTYLNVTLEKELITTTITNLPSCVKHIENSKHNITFWNKSRTEQSGLLPQCTYFIRLVVKREPHLLQICAGGAKFCVPFFLKVSETTEPVHPLSVVICIFYIFLIYEDSTRKQQGPFCTFLESTIPE